MPINSELRDVLKGRVTIVGVGNVMRGDDGLGAILADRLKDKISAGVINAGAVPENHIKAIRNSKPDTILLIDAADFGGGAGDIKLLRKDEIPLYGLSTHNTSLALLFSFLENDTKAAVYMLAVQPDKSGINTSLSGIMEKRCSELESLFIKLMPIQAANYRP
jgi:hydrogenase 3 maturation protease